MARPEWALGWPAMALPHLAKWSFLKLQSRRTIRGLSRAGATVGHGTVFVGSPIAAVAPGSTFAIGERCLLISKGEETALGTNHPIVLRTVLPSAQLVIGDDVGVSGGSIIAAYSVSIGDGCLIGANVTIVDTDFHPLRGPDRRYQSMSEPSPDDAVSIGGNVFIGTGAILLKGSDIGDDAVIGAGAVVKGPVVAGSTVAGNPARALHRLDILDDL